ncbi:bifunctional hydroxymethylpyrimidine kinase/phosphomethylpyrimidine kinase [bacterium]|nr:MAG: bifunctional hydroxymethylpyrimidine kinase/phosphomethylpyrimidine kinase [bacterium]
MKRALTIAGFDPSSRAGVTADLHTFNAFGVDGVSAVTALTAQNRRTCYTTEPVPAAFLAKQIRELVTELKIDAVKIGMLATCENVRTVASVIKANKLKNIVLDTVFRSTSGHALLDKEGIAEIRLLLKLATVATPNLTEASILLKRKVTAIYDMEDAAKAVYLLGPSNVVIKGGHLPGAPVDVLFDGKKFSYFESRRIKADRPVLHGTGCVFSSALASGLAKGRNLITAVKDAKQFVEDTLKQRNAQR